VKAGTHTQAEAGAEVGVSQQAVSKVLNTTKMEVTSKRVVSRRPPQPTIKLANPALTARNILAKMGPDYCHQLIAELQAQLIAEL